MADNQQGFPAVPVPFTDPQTGKIQQAWLQLLIALWNRTGGSPGGDIIVVIDDLLILAAELEALTIRTLADPSAAALSVLSDALNAQAVLATQQPLPAPLNDTALLALLRPVAQGGCCPDNLLGLAQSIFAASLMVARTISMTGDVTWTVTFDGSVDVTAAGTLATVNADVGTYSNPTVTVNAKGLVTAISSGAGAGSGTATATEALAAGDLCNVYSSSGIKIRKADATDDTKPANAFVIAAVLISGTATWYGPALLNTAVSSLTPGATYFLATTPGTITVTPPASAGNLVQKVGFAKSATDLVFFPSDGVTV